MSASEYISGSKNPRGVDWAFREALDRPLPSERRAPSGGDVSDRYVEAVAEALAATRTMPGPHLRDDAARALAAVRRLDAEVIEGLTAKSATGLLNPRAVLGALGIE